MLCTFFAGNNMKNRHFPIIILRVMLIHKRIAFLHSTKPVVQPVNAAQYAAKVRFLGGLRRLQDQVNLPFRMQRLQNAELFILIQNPFANRFIHHVMIRKQVKMNLLNLLSLPAVGNKRECLIDFRVPGMHFHRSRPDLCKG